MTYTKQFPDFIDRLANVPEMQRLKGVASDCGLSYTKFPLYVNAPAYTRFDHSLGCAGIVWNFTEDPKQTIAALFHDIATPTFAHTVDFMRGDHLKQEATEDGTETIIRSSGPICAILDELKIDVGDVTDYKKYPIADNPSPHLSADRLEYTCAGLVRYGVLPECAVQRCYDDLTVSDDGKELMFRTEDCARLFSFASLACSRIYISAESRYTMQMLSELLSDALKMNVIDPGDLMTTDHEVADKLLADVCTADRYRKITELKEIRCEGVSPDSRIVYIKKRYIDPSFAGAPFSQINGMYRDSIRSFKNTSFDEPILGL